MEPGMSHEYAQKAVVRVTKMFPCRIFSVDRIGRSERFKINEGVSQRSIEIGFIPRDILDEIIFSQEE